jgi:hypothetical protein
MQNCQVLLHVGKLHHEHCPNFYIEFVCEDIFKLPFNFQARNCTLRKDYATLPFNFSLILCHFSDAQFPYMSLISKRYLLRISSMSSLKKIFHCYVQFLLLTGHEYLTNNFFGDGWQTSITDLVKAEHVHRGVIVSQISRAWHGEGLFRLGS